jgi:tetratricopeptide (TPR) repeat protein
MDGRWKLALAGVFAGLVGCTTTTTPPNTLPVAPPVQTGKNAVFVPEPPDDGEKKTGPLAPSTMLVFARTWVESVAQDPNKPAAERERLLGQARQAYADILAKDPKSLDALMGLGEMYQVTGEQDRLTDVMGRVTRLRPTDPKAWAWVAVKQAQAKNWNAAADSYGRAVKLDPDNRQYRIHLGFTLARAGRYDEGYECLAGSMREAEARYNLAMMLLHNGETERARAELERCLKADPNFGAASEKLSALAAGNSAPAAPALAPDVKSVGFEELAPVQLNHGR